MKFKFVTTYLFPSSHDCFPSPTSFSPLSTQSMDSNDGGQVVPDQLLGTMLSAQKGGGPKPFSYGIDMSELKK